ncbi:MAG: phage protein Gp36 family protein [Candidatus Bilamarchaeaceae archaeon]
MPVQLYCSSADVEAVFSLNGVTWSVDDDFSGEAETVNYQGRNEQQYVYDAIERATVKINQYVAKLYDLSSLVGNTWTRWACAILAARSLARRKGNPAPDGLVADAEEVLEFLEQVYQGRAVIPPDGESDARLLSTNAGICMSNLNLDQRFPTAKVRVVQRISTGPSQSRLRRYYDLRSIQTFE